MKKREAAERARCSVRTIERAIAAGELEANGRPRHRLIDRAKLDAWIIAGALLVVRVAVILVLLALACMAACEFSPTWAELMRDVGCPLV